MLPRPRPPSPPRSHHAWRTDRDGEAVAADGGGGTERARADAAPPQQPAKERTPRRAHAHERARTRTHGDNATPFGRRTSCERDERGRPMHARGTSARRCPVDARCVTGPIHAAGRRVGRDDGPVALPAVVSIEVVRHEPAGPADGERGQHAMQGVSARSPHEALAIATTARAGGPCAAHAPRRVRAGLPQPRHLVAVDLVELEGGELHRLVRLLDLLRLRVLLLLALLACSAARAGG